MSVIDKNYSNKHSLCMLAAVYCLLFPQEAFAYLDPGTGSMLVSALVGIVATLLFFLKGIFYKGVAFLYSLAGRTHRRTRDSIVFYCEGAQYWNVFSPVLEALTERKEPCTYLTSDPSDPGLSFPSDTVTARYIGKGNKAYTTLNMLEADIVCMTTPGLEVLQIHRSKGVGHYAHVLHAPSDISMYRLFSFDFYDSLLLSGPYQEKTAREFECQRKTGRKELFHCGCPYYDVLMQKKKAFRERTRDGKGAHLLVAPSWGPSALLTVYGMDLLRPLAETGYELTIRPHPQSRIVEQDLLQRLKAETKQYANVSWDESPDNFAAMAQADMLISDFSAITMDFAFVFERPVLVMDYTPDLSVYDAWFLPWEVWDFSAHNYIGRKLKLEDIPHIADIARDMLNDAGFSDRLRRFRDENVYNFGCAGPVIADKLIEIRNRVQQGAGEEE